MRHLSWIVTLPIALVAISFAVSNMQPVTLALWPLPGAVTTPVFLVVLLAMAVGFLAGGLVAWLGQHSHRRAARIHSARADRLERELARAREQEAALERRVAAASAPVLGPADAGGGSGTGRELAVAAR